MSDGRASDPPPPPLPTPLPPPPPPPEPVDRPVDPPSPDPRAARFAAIPLRARALLPVAIDLLATSSGALRAASFYVGALAVVTIGPALLVLWAALDTLDEADLDPAVLAEGPYGAPLVVAICLAFVGLVVITVESRILATAIVGGRVVGATLRMPGVLAWARTRFWAGVGALVLTGLVTQLGTTVGDAAARSAGASDDVVVIVSSLAGVLAGTPFVYAFAGIVLGGVGVGTALRRSVTLARARPGLAVGIALFSIVGQLLVILGLGAGVDLLVRVSDALALPSGGVGAAVGLAGVIAIAFALGTLLFTVEAIAAAPAAFGFIGLTHYAAGVDAAERAIAAAPGSRRVWLTGPLVIGLVVGLMAAVVALVPEAR